MFTGHREVKSMSMVVLPDLSMVTFKGWVATTPDPSTDTSTGAKSGGQGPGTGPGTGGGGAAGGSHAPASPRGFETSALGLGILHCNNLRSNTLYAETLASLQRREREHFLGPDGPDLLKALWLIWDGQVGRHRGCCTMSTRHVYYHRRLITRTITTITSRSLSSSPPSSHLHITITIIFCHVVSFLPPFAPAAGQCTPSTADLSLRAAERHGGPRQHRRKLTEEGKREGDGERESEGDGGWCFRATAAHGSR